LHKQLADNLDQIAKGAPRHDRKLWKEACVSRQRLEGQTMTDKPRRDASAEPIEVLSKITPERFNVMREMGYVAYREADGEIRVANAERLHHRLGLLGHAARIAVVRLAGGRLEDIADEDQSRLGKERINAGRGGVRHQAHIGFVDRLPSGDR
jgi:hypothetical protein